MSIVENDRKVSHVLIDFTEIPPTGIGHILVRPTPDDRELVQLAAQAMGMDQATFCRTVIVNAAYKVIKENAR